ncbi:MAG TPA: TIR domain-containing protein [Thermoanaerobaculia bacterium]|jgi:WD40 repeat protein
MNFSRSNPGEPGPDIFLSYNSEDRVQAEAIARELKSQGLNVFWDRDSTLGGDLWKDKLERALLTCRVVVVLIGRKGIVKWQKMEVSVALDRAVESESEKERNFLLLPVLLEGAKPPERFLGQYVWVDLRKGVRDPEAIEDLIASIQGQRTKRQEERSRKIQEELKQHIWEKLAKYRKLQLVSALSLLLLAIAVVGDWRWRVSLSRALAAEAAGLHQGPRDIALLLALQAERTYDTPEARSSLLGLLEESQGLQAFLPGHKGPVITVAYSPDGSIFATAGRDKIFLWDTATGKRLGPPLEGHSGRILGLAFKDRSVLASCGEDETIQLWDLGSYRRLQTPLPTRLPALRNLVFNPDGSLLAASSGTSIYLWEYPTLRHRDPILVQGPWVSGLTFRRDGVLASASGGSITLWSLDHGTPMSTFSTPSADGRVHQILALAFSPRAGSPVLASAGEDKMVRLWNSSTGKPLGEPSEAHSDMVTSVAFSADGNLLASAGRDSVIYLWNVERERWDAGNWRPIRALFGHGRTVWSLAFGTDRHLVSGGDEGSVILWNLAAPSRFITKAPEITGEIDSVAFSPNGQALFAGGKDGVLRQLDTVNWRVREEAPGHTGKITALATQGQRLISAGEDGRILLWDPTDLRKPPRELKGGRDGNTARIGSLALSLDGRTVAAGDEAIGARGVRVRFWRTDTLQFLGELAQRSPGLSALAFDPQGRLLASGSLGGEIQLWDAQGRRPVGKPMKGDDLYLHNIISLAFDPEGKILAAASGDNTVRLWDTKSRRPLAGSPLTGARGLLTGLAFSPHGDRIAASSLDGTIFLWGVKSRAEIGTGLQGEGSLQNVAFHPTGGYLVSGTDQSLLRFDLHSSNLQEMACQIVRRNLTDAERERFLHWDIFYHRACLKFPDDD